MRKDIPINSRGYATLALNHWLTDTTAFRLHLTHTDLDGAACRLVLKAASMIRPEFNGENIDYCSCEAGSKNIHRAIDDWFKTIPCTGQEKDRLGILITDLGGLDMKTLKHIQEFARTNGMDYYIVVVDHHGTYPTPSMRKALASSDFSMKVVPEYGFWYSKEDGSASKHLADLIFNDSTPLRIYAHIDEVQEFLDRLSAYVDDVSTYDTGHWDTWNLDEGENRCTGPIEEQVVFDNYMTERKNMLGRHFYLHYTNAFRGDDMVGYAIEDYVIMRLTVMISCIDISEFCDSSILSPYPAINDAIYEKYENALASGIATLDSQYLMLKQLADHCTAPEKGVFTYDGKEVPVPSLDGKGILMFKSSELLYGHSFFSIISRSILEEFADKIAIIAMLDEERGTMELRSSGDVDVAEIARNFGGGGHLHAAGFPVEKST